MGKTLAVVEVGDPDLKLAHQDGQMLQLGLAGRLIGGGGEDKGEASRQGRGEAGPADDVATTAVTARGEDGALGETLHGYRAPGTEGGDKTGVEVVLAHGLKEETPGRGSSFRPRDENRVREARGGAAGPGGSRS